MFGNVLSKGVKEKWSLGYLEQVVKRYRQVEVYTGLSHISPKCLSPKDYKCDLIFETEFLQI